MNFFELRHCRNYRPMSTTGSEASPLSQTQQHSSSSSTNHSSASQATAHHNNQSSHRNTANPGTQPNAPAPASARVFSNNQSTPSNQSSNNPQTASSVLKKASKSFIKLAIGLWGVLAVLIPIGWVSLSEEWDQIIKTNH